MRKAFTLIELMVVVAIIAILAAIAIPQYKQFQLKAKTSEAKTNLGAINSCEEAYSAENDYYRSTKPTPDSTPGPAKQTWNGTDTGFDDIGFEPAGSVYYQYGVAEGSSYDPTAGAPGDTAGPDNVTVNSTIYVGARGDLDGDTKFGGFYITNQDSKIVDANPGEF